MESQIQGLIALLQSYAEDIKNNATDDNRTWKQSERLEFYSDIQQTFSGTTIGNTVSSYLQQFNNNPSAIINGEKELIDSLISGLKETQSENNLKADAYALNLNDKIQALKDDDLEKPIKNQPATQPDRRQQRQDRLSRSASRQGSSPYTAPKEVTITEETPNVVADVQSEQINAEVQGPTEVDLPQATPNITAEVQSDKINAEVQGPTEVNIPEATPNIVAEAQSSQINAEVQGPTKDIFSVQGLKENPDLQVYSSSHSLPIQETQTEILAREKWKEKSAPINEQYTKGEISWDEFQKQTYEAAKQQKQELSDIENIRAQLDQRSQNVEKQMDSLTNQLKENRIDSKEYTQSVQNILSETGDRYTVAENIDKYAQQAEQAIIKRLEPLKDKLANDKSLKLSSDDVNNIIGDLVSKNIQELSGTQQISDIEKTVNNVLRNELPNQLKQYGAHRISDKYYDDTITDVTKGIASDQKVITATTLSSVMGFIPYASEMESQLDNHILSSSSQDKFWESFKQSFSPEETSNLSRQIATAMIGTSMSPETQAEANNIIQGIIQNAINESGFQYDTNKASQVEALVKQQIDQAIKMYSSSNDITQLDSASQEIVRQVNDSLLQGKGRSSNLSFLTTLQNERKDLSPDIVLDEVAREDTSFEIQDTLKKLVPNLTPEQYTELSEEAVATMYGRAYLQPVQQSKNGQLVYDKNGAPAFVELGKDQNGNPIYKYKVVNTYGLLSDFTSTFSPAEQALLNRMSPEAKQAFFDSMKDKHKEYLIDGAIVTITSILKDKNLLTPEISQKFNNLTLKDIYTPDQQAYLIKEAAEKGIKLDLDRKITLTEALNKSLGEHSLHFDSFIKKMEQLEDKSAQRRNKPLSDSYRKSTAKNFLNDGVSNVQRYMNPNAVQGILTREILNRPLNVFGFVLTSFGVSTKNSLPAMLMNVNMPFIKQQNYFNAEVTSFFKKTGIPAHLILEKGEIPAELRKKLSFFERKKLDRLIREGKAIKTMEKFRNDHKVYSGFMDLVSGANRSTKAQIGSETLGYIVHGDIGGLSGLWAGRGMNLLTNIALEKAGWIYDPSTKSYVHPRWENTKEKISDLKSKAILKIKNSKPVKAVSSKISEWIQKFLATTIGKILQKVGKLVSKIMGLIVKSLTVVLGVISGIDMIIGKLLGFIGLGRLYQQFKQLIKLTLAVVIYNIFAPILTAVFGFFGSIGSLFSAPAAGSSLAVHSIPNAAATVNFNFGGTNSLSASGLGWTSSVMTSIRSFFASMSNLSLSQLFVAGQGAFASLFAWAGPLGFAGMFTLAFGVTVGAVYHSSVMTAFKDPIDKLKGEIVATNPLQVSKSAVPNTLDANSPNINGTQKGTTFNIKITTPPCSDSIIVKDSIPKDAQYVVDSIFPKSAPPNDPFIKEVKAIDTDPSNLQWEIILDQTKLDPSNCSGGPEDLENPDSITLDEIKAILDKNSTNMKGNAISQQFYDSAHSYKINPLLVIGIFYFESELGNTGIGRPRTASGGCWNPGGMRGGNAACASASNGNFRMFNSYEGSGGSIDETFKLLRNDYLDQNLKTVNEIIDKYTPYADKNAQNNPNSKRIVKCTLANKTPCRDNVSGTNFSGSFVTLDIGFKAAIPDLSPKCVTNTAFANTKDYSNSSSTTVSVGGEDCFSGGEFCSTDPATITDENEILTKLSDAKIYVTNSPHYPPKQKFTRHQLNLVWKLACRATQSQTFMTMAAGNDGFEIQKIACNPPPSSFQKCPLDPKHRAYFKAQSPFSVNAGARLLLITNKMDEVGDELFIHLVGHEMGHSAQYAGGQAASSNAYNNFLRIFNNKAVSNYSDSYTTFQDRAIETHAEMIGFYLTHGEAHSQYHGPLRDFSQDTGFLTASKEYYNHLKNDYFDGKEFANCDLGLATCK